MNRSAIHSDSKLQDRRGCWVGESCRRIGIAVVLAVTIGVAGCSSEPQGQGPGKREQILALTPAQELKIGQLALQKVLENATVIDSGPEVEQVRRVSERIIQAVGIEPLRREINLQVEDYQFEWEQVVLEEDQVNAFCLPGGKIVVLSGLMRIIQNDDQLATVIAHEVAHVLARHASERVARERTAGHGILSLAYNRQQESEADHIGVFLMTFAGYDPDESVEFWKQMQSAKGAGIHLPEVLSDHPSDARRMQQLQAWVTAAKAGKHAFDSGHIAPQ